MPRPDPRRPRPGSISEAVVDYFRQPEMRRTVESVAAEAQAEKAKKKAARKKKAPVKAKRAEGKR